MTHAHEDTHGHSHKDEYEDGGAVAFSVVYTCIALAIITAIMIFG